MRETIRFPVVVALLVLVCLGRAPTTAVVPSRILRIIVLLMAGEPAVPWAALPPRTGTAAASRRKTEGRRRGLRGLCPGPPAPGNRAESPGATYLRHCGEAATAWGASPPIAATPAARRGTRAAVPAATPPSATTGTPPRRRAAVIHHFQ